MLLVRARVDEVIRLSPSFVRIVLGHPDLADFGVEGALRDQRIKFVLPGPDGLPTLSADGWWEDFLALPPDSGVAMRTYTIAGVRGTGPATRVLVDVVVHPGASGPGARWAGSARPDDEVLLLAPRRGEDTGGIEFDPGDAGRVLLVGDETAVPAVVSILRDLPPGLSGSAFLEVPTAADVRRLDERPPDVEVTWLPREGRPVGDALVETVSRHLGFAAPDPVTADDVDPEIWETPGYSSSGEEIAAPGSPGTEDRYAWIAGESRMVTSLRRHLVQKLDLPRSRVAFMGYWREGVAMRG